MLFWSQNDFNRHDFLFNKQVHVLAVIAVLYAVQKVVNVSEHCLLSCLLAVTILFSLSGRTLHSAAACSLCVQPHTSDPVRSAL